MKVIFSKRAYSSLIAEVADKLATETGGLFLGHRDGDTWYVLETLDPGPNSVFQIAYFEYDQKYTNHLANKIAKIYIKPLKLIGLWHRHPGSFDQFSSTDDGTNRKFAQINNGEAISALVNIDPDFRLTMYQVSLPIKYKKIEFVVDDDKIPSAFKELYDVNTLADSIADARSQTYINRNILTLHDILSEIEPNLQPMAVDDTEVGGDKLLDEDIDVILEKIDADLQFLSRMGIQLNLHVVNDHIECHENGESTTFSIYLVKNKNLFSIFIGDKRYLYDSGTIESVYNRTSTSILNSNAWNVWSKLRCKILSLIKK